MRAGICGAIPAGLSVDGIRASSATLQQPRQPASFGDADYEVFLRSLSTPCPGAPFLRQPASALGRQAAGAVAPCLALLAFPCALPGCPSAQLLDLAFGHFCKCLKIARVAFRMAKATSRSLRPLWDIVQTYRARLLMAAVS